MARTGLYKSEVKKARDALLAQSKHPSVDAVRIALGNTGSKTTIHKYLKELETEDGGSGGRQASISEALQDLVARLAAQLQDDANTQIDTLRAEHAEQDRRHAEALAAVRQEAERLSGQLQRVDKALQQEQAAHNVEREALQRETIARHTAEQQVADIKERLAENEVHRQSLEEKHQHAREALEHYRQSMKEQRDIDQRRHEQQVQQLQAEIRHLQQALVVKQEEITKLNQEGVRLVSELSHTRQMLHEAQEHGRRQASRLDTLQAVEQRNGTLLAQVIDKDHHLQALQSQLAAASGKVRELELALAQAHAKEEVQQGIAAELRTVLGARERRATKEAR